jgi:antitoxin HicB
MGENLNYPVVLEPQPEGGFTVTVPALPEVVSQGETEAEALEMVRDAIELALAVRRDLGEEIPEPAQSILRYVKIASAA